MEAHRDHLASFEPKRRRRARTALIVLTLAVAFSCAFLGVLWHAQRGEPPPDLVEAAP
jgi:hypothetical protein